TDTVGKDVVNPSGYTVSIDQASITSENKAAFSFTFAGAEVGATYNYTITSSGGGSVTGSGTIGTATDTISGINVGSLPDGTLTLNVTLTDIAGNIGSAAIDTIGKDTSAPNGYSVSIGQSFIYNGNKTSMSFTFAGAEVGATYNYSITSSGGAGSATGSGIIATAADTISGIDVSGLQDGTLTLRVTLTDTNGNTSGVQSDTVVKDAAVVAVINLNPTNNSNNVGLSNNLVITFNKTVIKGTGNIKIYKASDDSIVETIDVTTSKVAVSGKQVTINPDTTFAYSTKYYVNIDSTAFNDAVNNGYAGISNKTDWNFTTQATPPPPPQQTQVSADAKLSGLTLSSGTLSPVFGSATTSYTASVGNEVTSIKVTPTVNESHATVKVNGFDVISGSSSGDINLNVGANTVTVTVKAQDTTTTKTYTITVTRATADPKLSGLTLSSGSLNPEFDPATTLYTASVGNEVTSIKVTPTVDESHATVKVNGSDVISGSSSGNIKLNVGDNTVTVTVKAQDTKTTKTYTVTVIRASASSGSPGKINGDPIDGTSKTETVGGKTVTTVALDDEVLQKKLSKVKDNAEVVIPVNTGADVVVGQLNGQTIKNMERKDAVLEIKTGNVSYVLPAVQINIDAVSNKIGKHVELKDIKVQVTVAEPSKDTAKIVQDTANKNSYQVVIKPVEFEITCTSGSETVEVSKFNDYVERLVAVPDGIDPAKITTGIVLNDNETFSHVPTKIVVIDGKYYAKINSLTNSTYSVIWNPVTFEDVQKHWGKEDVEDMASRLVMDGVSKDKFMPDQKATRAEFTDAVIRALGLKRSGAGKKIFTDVGGKHEYYDSITIAYEYGILKGDGKGKCNPDAYITRQEAMTILSRAMIVAKMDVTASSKEIKKFLSGYKDGNKVSTWAKTAVVVCIRDGIVEGYDKELGLQENITRAQTAAFVRRMLIKAGLI
ncbi:MAG TPA: cadherin-like beta sandwich domain-containing protein, partial [Clostridia bacterium]|nr:cadherin-like beta sandwich domain-containing protein [Clostridia bacterium]